MKQVVDHFGLRFDREQLMTRCCECNGHVSERLTAAQLSNRPAAVVPAHVLATTDEFWGCARCGKVRRGVSSRAARHSESARETSRSVWHTECARARVLMLRQARDHATLTAPR
jgi:hypothetical protein